MLGLDSVMQRFVCDQIVMEKIVMSTKCKTCNKASLANNFYNNSCHQGSYCQPCSNQLACCKGKEQPNFELQSCLRQVKVRCINYMKGCLELLTFDKLQKHEDECPIKPKKAISPVLQVKAEPFIPKFEIPELNRSNVMMHNMNMNMNMNMAKPFPSFDPFPRQEEPSKESLIAKINSLESKMKEMEGKMNGMESVVKTIEDLKANFEESFKGFAESKAIIRIFDG